MQFKFHIFSVFLITLFLLSSANAEKIHNVIPKEGYVPNKSVAIKIALAVWEPIYGQSKIKSEAPYKANLDKGIWVVTGSLLKGWKGGVALINIDKMSGKILRVSHGK